MSSNSILFSNLSPEKVKKKLSCPDCDLNMSSYRCQTKIVFKCYSCEGIWFKKDGFSTFKNTLDQFDLSKIAKVYKPYKDDILNISACPTCNQPLDEQNYSYKTDVKINKCSKCEGLWLKLYDMLTLVECSQLSQSVREDAKNLAQDVALLTKLKKKMNNPFSFLGIYNRNKRWMFLLTPLALIAMVATVLVAFVYWVTEKVIQRDEQKY